MNNLKNKLFMLFTKDKEVQVLVLNYDFSNKYLVAQLGKQRAIISSEDISIYQGKNTNEQVHKLLGSTIRANIIGINDDNDIILSRKELMFRKVEKYTKGDIVEATIVSFSNNALYLEFDEGLVGKMYTNQLTSAKVEKPADLYKVGDKIQCVIDKKQDDSRFILSRLSLYKRNNLKIANGNILKCRITQKVREEPGYFVEVISNPLYSGIFDVNKYNANVNYKIGDIINLRVVDVKDNKHLRFRTNINQQQKEAVSTANN